MKKTIKNLSIYLFTILSQFIPKYLIQILPKIITDNIPRVYVLLIFDAVIVALLLFFFKDEIKEEFKILKKDPINLIGDNAKYYLYGFMAMAAINMLISVLTSIDSSDNQQLIDQIFVSYPIYVFVSAVILAPLNEELIYRKLFKNVIKNKTLYLVMSGLFFGLVHVIYSFDSWKDLLFIFSYGALGYTLAYIYDKSKTIFVPIFYHSFHNLVAFLMMTLGSLF